MQAYGRFTDFWRSATSRDRQQTVPCKARRRASADTINEFGAATIQDDRGRFNTEVDALGQMQPLLLRPAPQTETEFDADTIQDDVIRLDSELEALTCAQPAAIAPRPKTKPHPSPPPVPRTRRGHTRPDWIIASGTSVLHATRLPSQQEMISDRLAVLSLCILSSMIGALATALLTKL